MCFAMKSPLYETNFRDKKRPFSRERDHRLVYTCLRLPNSKNPYIPNFKDIFNDVLTAPELICRTSMEQLSQQGISDIETGNSIAS